MHCQGINPMAGFVKVFLRGLLIIQKKPGANGLIQNTMWLFFFLFPTCIVHQCCNLQVKQHFQERLSVLMPGADSPCGFATKRVVSFPCRNLPPSQTVLLFCYFITWQCCILLIIWNIFSSICSFACLWLKNIPFTWSNTSQQFL